VPPKKLPPPPGHGRDLAGRRVTQSGTGWYKKAVPLRVGSNTHFGQWGRSGPNELSRRAAPQPLPEQPRAPQACRELQDASARSASVHEASSGDCFAPSGSGYFAGRGMQLDRAPAKRPNESWRSASSASLVHAFTAPEVAVILGIGVVGGVVRRHVIVGARANADHAFERTTTVALCVHAVVFALSEGTVR